MMTIRKTLLASLFALICAAGCTSASYQSEVTLSTATTVNDVRAGAKLYSQHCAACHGRDAQGGGRAPSLHRESVQAMTNAALVRFLTDGDLRKGMPSWSSIPEERRWQ